MQKQLHALGREARRADSDSSERRPREAELRMVRDLMRLDRGNELRGANAVVANAVVANAVGAAAQEARHDAEGVGLL